LISRIIYKVYVLLYVLVYAFLGEYHPARPYNHRSKEYLMGLDWRGVTVWEGPLPDGILGVSFPPVPLIILAGGLWDVEVLLHEYGHIVGGVRSSEEDAVEYARLCLREGRLV